MKALVVTTIIAIFSVCAFGEDLASRHPLAGKTSVTLAKDAKLHLEQNGDVTSVVVNGNVIVTLESPQFIAGLTQSNDLSVVALLINKDRPRAKGASDYHSVLRLRFNTKGAVVEKKRLLKKTDEFMKPLNRWIVNLDSILNDGRTARMKFGERRAGGRRRSNDEDAILNAGKGS